MINNYSNIQKIIECNKWAVFVVSDHLFKYTLDNNFGKLYKSKLLYANEWYVALSQDESTFSYPQFKKSVQLKYGFKSYIKY